MFEKMYLENIEELRVPYPAGQNKGSASPKKLDLLFYWRALRRKKWLIALFTALITAIAVYYSMRAVPIYGAKATLLLESQKANIISIEDLVSTEQESIDYLGTQYAILRSRGLADRVVDYLLTEKNYSQEELTELLQSSGSSNSLKSVFQLISGVFEPSGASDDSPARVVQSDSESELLEAGIDDSIFETSDRTGDREWEKLLDLFRDSFSISPVAKTKLITIGFESPDPEFSALAANAIADQYIESVIEQRSALKGEASTWMDGRIAELKIKLDQSEDDLLAFKKSNDLVDLGGDVGRLNEQELILANSELTEARNELSGARDMYRKAQSYKDSTPELLETLPFVQTDVLVRSITTEMGQAQRAITELKNRYGAKHPAVIDAESRLESQRSTLDRHVQRAVTAFETDYQLLQQRVASLQSNVVQGKESIQLIGQQKISLEALEREVSANREQYNKLFDRITETRTADGLDEANAVVAEAAWVPTLPVKPNKKLIVGLAFIGSLLLSAFVAFFLEYMDDTVTSTEEFKRRLDTRVLGALPLVTQKSSGHRNSYPLTPSRAFRLSETFSEAIRSCRTALSIRANRDLQIILVTSSVPDEGKSTVALNLAYSFGKIERTLLIDCDLRKPSIARALELGANTAGLSDTLLLKENFNQCVRLNVLDTFDCLCSGPIPEQPLELLSSWRFAKLLTLLRDEYDKIIIDSAPTHVVSDSLVISRLADGVLYVVKPEHTPIKLIGNCLSRLKEASANVVGVCFSQVDVNKAKAYGGSEFYGFGDSYSGYGDCYKSKEPARVY